jgi:hypothetical protein
MLFQNNAVIPEDQEGPLSQADRLQELAFS